MKLPKIENNDIQINEKIKNNENNENNENEEDEDDIFN